MVGDHARPFWKKVTCVSVDKDNENDYNCNDHVDDGNDDNHDYDDNYDDNYDKNDCNNGNHNDAEDFL